MYTSHEAHSNAATAAAPYVLGPLSASGITALTFTTLGIAILCVFARLYARFYIVGPPWWDDLCIAFGFLCAIAQSILTQVMVKYGLGQHMYDLHVKDWTPFNKV